MVSTFGSRRPSLSFRQQRSASSTHLSITFSPGDKNQVFIIQDQPPSLGGLLSAISAGEGTDFRDLLVPDINGVFFRFGVECAVFLGDCTRTDAVALPPPAKRDAWNQKPDAGPVPDSIGRLLQLLILRFTQPDAGNNPFVLPRTTFAYFLENRWTPASRWSITAGVRADDIRTAALPPDAYGERPAIPGSAILQVNPHLSLAWLAHGGAAGSGFGATRLHASFGTGIRAPSGFELAFTNNPELKPERSLSFDAGVDQQLAGERVVLSATYFYNRFKDEIEVLGGSLSNLSTYTTANLGNARAQGVELSLRVQPTSSLRLETGYTFMPTSILALDGSSAALAPFEVGQPLIRRPRNSGYYTVAWSRQRLTLSNSGYWRGQALDLEPNDGTYACQLGLPCLFENKEYVRLDGGFSYRAYRGLELYGQIYNLLDRHYEEILGFPALPLNFMAGIRFNFTKE